MLWLTLGILLLELFMMYTKYDFLNVRRSLTQLLVLVTILSIFLLNYFDTTYIKICMGLTSISIVLDLIWLMAYAGDYWSPPTSGMHSQNQTATLRFIVLFTVLLMAAKVPPLVMLGTASLPALQVPGGHAELYIHDFAVGLRQAAPHRQQVAQSLHKLTGFCSLISSFLPQQLTLILLF